MAYENCSVCGKEDYLKGLVEHHTSYFPEETILVCPHCHGLIHKTNLYPELRPKRGDSLVYYKNLEIRKRLLKNRRRTL